jgi:hypothetical protein
MENEKMKRSWERRLAALEARARDALPANRLLTPCTCRQDACSRSPNPCSFDDVAPDNQACVVDLQGCRSCSARRRKQLMTVRVIELYTNDASANMLRRHG